MAHGDHYQHYTPKDRVPGLITAVALLGFAGLVFGAYAVPLRRKEWVDIMLDYSHHKRTNYNGSYIDRLSKLCKNKCFKA